MLLSMVAVLELVFQSYFALKNQPAEYHNPRISIANYKGVEWADAYWREHFTRRFEYDSYVGWRGIAFKGTHLNIDDHGYRVTLNSMEPSDDIREVAFLGGSTMWGEGSNDANTIPSLFAGMVDSAHVRNLGQWAFTARQSLISLQQEIAQGYRPDWVISYDGVNDAPYGRRSFANKREEQIRIALKGADRNSLPFLWATKRFARALMMIFSGDEDKLPDRYLVDEAKSLECARDVLESWLSLKATCDAYGTNLLVILQPNAGVGQPNLSNLKNFGKGFLEDGKAETTARYYDQIKSLLQNDRYDVLLPHFIDLTSAFDEVPNVYLDFCHVSPNGNAIIAEEVRLRLNKMNTEQNATD